MIPFLATVRKQLFETRWLLGLCALALFGLSWLLVFMAARYEQQMRTGDPIAQFRGRAFMRGLGGPSADDSSTSYELAGWRHPFIYIILGVWAIARGSASVAGDLEKGSMDLVLSRPVSRTAYYSSQLAVGVIGLFILGIAMIVGNQVGNHYNRIETPPGVAVLIKPAVTAMALGFVIFGYTTLFSAFDSVRWRPNLIASALTLAGFVALFVSTFPISDEWKKIDRLSIFRLYDPIDAALKAEHFNANSAILGGIGLASLLVGLVYFNGRDLPSSS